MANIMSETTPWLSEELSVGKYPLMEDAFAAVFSSKVLKQEAMTYQSNHQTSAGRGVVLFFFPSIPAMKAYAAHNKDGRKDIIPSHEVGWMAGHHPLPYASWDLLLDAYLPDSQVVVVASCLISAHHSMSVMLGTILPHTQENLLTSSGNMMASRQAKMQVVSIDLKSAGAVAPPFQCDHCGEREDENEGKKLFRCRRCKLARYCGEQCQEAGWKACHKKECKTYRLMCKEGVELRNLHMNYDAASNQEGGGSGQAICAAANGGDAEQADTPNADDKMSAQLDNGNVERLTSINKKPAAKTHHQDGDSVNGQTNNVVASQGVDATETRGTASVSGSANDNENETIVASNDDKLQGERETNDDVTSHRMKRALAERYFSLHDPEKNQTTVLQDQNYCGAHSNGSCNCQSIPIAYPFYLVCAVCLRACHKQCAREIQGSSVFCCLSCAELGPFKRTKKGNVKPKTAAAGKRIAELEDQVKILKMQLCDSKQFDTSVAKTDWKRMSVANALY